jgi:hypothetical protein
VTAAAYDNNVAIAGMRLALSIPKRNRCVRAQLRSGRYNIMAGIEWLFAAIGAWFGFVGSCVADAGPTCRPFLAFVALTAAAGVALTLLVLAYKALQKDQAPRIEHAGTWNEPQTPERTQRPADARTAQQVPSVRGWQVPA